VVIVVPKESRYSFVGDIKSVPGTSSIIDYLDQRFHRGPFDVDCASDIANICHLAINTKRRQPTDYNLSIETMDKITSIAVGLLDFLLFEKVTSLRDTTQTDA